MRKSQNKPFPVRSCYTSRLGVVYDANNFSADFVPDASSSRLDSVWRLESVKERINKLEKTLLGLTEVPHLRRLIFSLWYTTLKSHSPEEEILFLLLELKRRNATLFQFFNVCTSSQTDNIRANLSYFDYRTIVEEENKAKHENGAS
ncbi:MAG: hypothetical protein II486_12110 [Thermoguttaceae bacterium]|nr:hypothetical protein [Thermoguttaceae bacterium]